MHKWMTACFITNDEGFDKPIEETWRNHWSVKRKTYCFENRIPHKKNASKKNITMESPWESALSPLMCSTDRTVLELLRVCGFITGSVWGHMHTSHHSFWQVIVNEKMHTLSYIIWRAHIQHHYVHVETFMFSMILWKISWALTYSAVCRASLGLGKACPSWGEGQPLVDVHRSDVQLDVYNKVGTWSRKPKPRSSYPLVN